MKKNDLTQIILRLLKNAFEEVDWSKQPKFDVVHFDVAPITEKTYDDFFNLVLHLSQQNLWLYLLNNLINEYAEMLNANS